MSMSVNETRVIFLVENKPEVWDTNSVHFRNKVLKKNAWKNIAEMLGSSPEICQNVWKKLRDRYARGKRQLTSGSEGGRRKWDKEESLRFLDKANLIRRTISNDKQTERCLPLENEGGESDDDNLDIPVNTSTQNTNSQAISESSMDEIQLLGSSESIEMKEYEVALPSYDLPGEENYEKDQSFNGATQSFNGATQSFNGATQSFNGATQSFKGATQSFKGATPSTGESSTRKKRATSRSAPEKDVAESLIRAIDKISDNAEQPKPLSTNHSFVDYSSSQLRDLLLDKDAKTQRMIRNRVLTFLDDLFDEFNN